MRIECIAIGTELLTTQRLDTNSVWIAERLAGLGLRLHRKTAVGDDREDLRALCEEAAGRSDLVVCTGGLGPTFDDFTKEVWADLFGVEMQEHGPSRAELDAFFARRNRVPSPSNYKQVLIPEGAEPLSNPLGTAPGVWWENPPGTGGARIAMLPGVPREMKQMWVDHVEPRLRALGGHPTRTLRMVVAGVPESLADERTVAIRERYPMLDWTILAGLTQVEFVVRSGEAGLLEAARADLAAEFGRDLAAEGEGNLEDAVLAGLRARGETLALAESMTGGLAASRLTAIPGASEAFRGGAVVYTPEAKAALGGLDPAFLQAHGTLGEATTLALARGIRERLGATWGLAVTGNAGPALDPSGGSSPLGAATLALVGPGVEETRALTLHGERQDIQLRAAAAALDLLRRHLQS